MIAYKGYVNSRFDVKIKLFFVFCLILSIWIYLPALSGGFVLDDSVIFKNGYLKIDQFSFEDLLQASMSTDTGPLRRPVAMFSFAIQHVLTGMDAWWMKLTNLLIHLFNGLLVLLVSRQLYRRCASEDKPKPAIVPYFLTAIWLVHPINVTAVSYIIQRMTSLSAMFVLLAIYCYLKLREGAFEDWRKYLLSISILFLWLLGMLTKETAILLSIYIFVIEWCLYGFKASPKSEGKHLIILWALLAAPWVCALLFSIYDASFLLNEYEFREFSALERVYTEFRVMIDYFRFTLIPDIRYMGLYHDNIVISQSLLSPISTLLSLLSIIGLLVLAIGVKNTAPIFCLGILWFFGGHVLESSIYPLEIKFFHRNYLPSIGLLLAATEVGLGLYRHYRLLMTGLALLILLGFSISTRFLNHQWSADFRMQILEVINNPGSIRANYRAGQIYSELALASKSENEKLAYRREATKYFGNIGKLDPHDITGDLSILENHLRFRETPSEELSSHLKQSISTTTVSFRLTNIYKSIVTCLIKEECLLEQNEVRQLMEALLNNPGLLSRQRGEISGNYASYVWALEGDSEGAISIVLEAISKNPSMPELYELLIYYYDQSGNYQDMRRAINALEGLDKFGQFRKYIRQAREVVDASVISRESP